MDWSSSLLWSIIGISGSFIVSLLFFMLGKRKRKLSYSISTNPIFLRNISKIPDITVTYKDKKIAHISYSHIEIKNIGNDTLEERDFPELNKLSLITDGKFLLNTIDELEVKSSNKSIKISPLLVSFNKIQLNFDYIDPKNIIECNIFHTGNIIVCGELKNGKIINHTQMEKSNNLTTNIFAIISFFGSLLSIISALFALFQHTK